jgi:membrane-bound metal-dependent hydrolase YbcI (DUF457 family)
LDNLTHSLFGLTLARTSLGRAGRGTTAALLLASNAPDVDIVTVAGGARGYLEWHRGPTHGPIGVAALALATAGIVTGWLRWSAARRGESNADDAPFGMLVVVSLVGIACHVLMDLPTSYGTRLLAPFDWHWYAVDWMPIVDVYLLVILGAGLLFGRGAPEARRRNAAIALTLMAVDYGVRGAAHHQALALAPRLFGPTLPPACDRPPEPTRLLDAWPRPAPSPPAPGRRCLVETAAMPTTSPFAWHVIAQMSNAFELHDVDLLDVRFRADASESDGFWRRSMRYPNVWTPPVEQAAATPLGRIFLGFSRFPAARTVVDASGLATVRITDMRFVASALLADPRARANLFTLVVRVGPDGRVASARLGR